MTSKTSSVNFGRQTLGVFLWQLRRSAPVAAVYAGLLLVGYPLALSLGLMHFGPFGLPAGSEGAFGMARAVTLVAMGLMVVFSAILTVSHFGSLYNKRQEDLFHALPIRREALFLGGYLAEVACLFVPLLLALLLEAALFAAWGLFTVSFLNYLLATLGLALLMDALVAAFFALPAVCSGTALECATSAGMLTLLWPCLVLGVSALISLCIPGSLSTFALSDPFSTTIYGNSAPELSVNSTYFSASAFSPPLAALVTFLYHNNNQNVYSDFPPWTVLFWLALLIVLVLLCLLACRKRKSEDAETAHSYGPLKTLLRILGGAGAGLVLGQLLFGFTGSVPLFFLGAALGLLLVYLLTELLYFRTFRSLPRHLPCLGGTVALLGAILLSVFLGLGMDTPMPKPDQLNGVTLQIHDVEPVSRFFTVRAVDSEKYQDYRDLKPVVSDPESLTKAVALNEKLLAYKRAQQYPYLPGCGAYYRFYDYDYSKTFTLTYYLKNGRTVTRSYSPFPSILTGEAEALYQEARELALELVREEEYVRGFYPINALETAVEIRKYTSYLSDEEWFGKKEYERGSRAEMDAWTLSEFADLDTFREKLEAALVSDFTHGRYSAEKAYPTGTYRIVYGEGKAFTAQGGWADTESASGSRFRSDYTQELSVTPEMTETYALLESLYGMEEPHQQDFNY